MVTTRITDAVPIAIPNPVSTERTGLARSACALNRTASPRNMAGLKSPAPVSEASRRRLAAGLPASKWPSSIASVIAVQHQDYVCFECRSAHGRTPALGCRARSSPPVSYTHLRAHETPEHLV